MKVVLLACLEDTVMKLVTLLASIVMEIGGHRLVTLALLGLYVFKIAMVWPKNLEIQQQMAKISDVLRINLPQIIGIMNHHVVNLRYNDIDVGIENWDDVRISSILNDRPMGTKIPVEKKAYKDFFVPVDLMRESIK